jgi:hypothetical protein
MVVGTPQKESTAARQRTVYEPEQVDTIARLPHPQDGGVAVNDVHRDAEPGRLADEIVEPTIGTLRGKDSAVRLGTEAGIIKGQLLARVDAG